MESGAFDPLTPFVVSKAVEETLHIRLDGALTAYPSYVNRVYGVADEDGLPYVVKFYRPGRWTVDAILEEHEFVGDCAAAELPVVAPIPGAGGRTLHATSASGDDRETEYLFSLYPKRAGRNFDAETPEDWRRLGSLVGRLHAVGAARAAHHRLLCSPEASSAAFLSELEASDAVHPDVREEFFSVARTVLDRIAPQFRGAAVQRIHGDCHRGNILSRGEEGLLLIDFDDMMTGPPVQDLWLLLPGRMGDCAGELAMILEGYEEFMPFDRSTLGLIEPLRFMRMLYFLAWCARQRGDRHFHAAYPDWGTAAFWMKEIEDMRDQADVVAS